MIEWIAIFAGGLLGSAHCVGMCGGFALAIGSAQRSFSATLIRQLIYSAGRLFTYMFLGAMGGCLGAYFSQFKSSLVSAQQIFSLIAGIIMLVVGLSVLGVIRLPRLTRGGGLIAPVFGHFLQGKSLWGSFSAGLATGFLPCGLVYSFLAMAVATGRSLQGSALMLCFGVGTIPAMVLLGCGSTFLAQATRRRIYQIAACVVIVLGGVTIARAFPRTTANCCHHSCITPAGTQTLATGYAPRLECRVSAALPQMARGWQNS